MNKVFSNRKSAWYRQNIKYLRYVFNDHFVLFLMILFGALGVQYVNFLQAHDLNVLEKVILAVLVSLLSQVFGRLATFVEAADKVFLLVKELEVRHYLRKCLLQSLIIPTVISVLLVGLAAPLLRLPLVFLVIWGVGLIGIKAIWLMFRLRQIQQSGVLDWSALIAMEEGRQTSILRFFALFTHVKGLKSHSRRRQYLDFLLPKTKRTYEYLFMRSFLRSGDYLGLTLRLSVLSILSMLFIHQPVIAVILVSVFNYLLLFQLLSLRSAFDYQLFTRIYPVKKTAKNSGLRAVIFRVMVFVTVLEVLLGGVVLRPVWLVLIVLVVNVVLTKFYVRMRLKK